MGAKWTIVVSSKGDGAGRWVFDAKRPIARLAPQRTETGSRMNHVTHAVCVNLIAVGAKYHATSAPWKIAYHKDLLNNSNTIH